MTPTIEEVRAAKEATRQWRGGNQCFKEYSPIFYKKRESEFDTIEHALTKLEESMKDGT